MLEFVSEGGDVYDFSFDDLFAGVVRSFLQIFDLFAKIFAIE